MKRPIFGGILASLCLGAILAPAAFGQGSGSNIYQRQLRVRLDQQRPAAQTATLDAGGWFTFALFKYDDAENERFRTLRDSELRLWAQATIADAHTGYVRAVAGYEDWNSGDAPDTHGDEFINPELERAWYQVDIAKIAGLGPQYGLKVKVGRQLLELGTGLAMSMPLDAVRVEGSVCNWHWMAFGARDLPNFPNFDESSAIIDRQKRCFYGGQVSYTGLSGHEIFAYYFRNNDRSSEYEPDPVRDALQDFGYDSHYIGVGSYGSMLDPNLRYNVELVGEVGRTFGDFATEADGQDEICAVAFDVQLEYLFDVPTRPKVWVEYLYASGDGDRVRNTSSTVGGNLPGTRDYAFNGFGFRDTGIAYAPSISNLNMWQVGGSFLPFENHRLLKDLEIGSKVYFYAKAAGGGPTGDSTITDRDSRWLGWEWDVYMDWRVTSDVSLTLRYGTFQPGAAYENDKDCRHFLYAALTYSF
jgi:hypothetical protein